MFVCAELIEFPVGLIAGIILSAVVAAMVAAKLLCVVSTRYRLRRLLTAAASGAGDIGSDADDEHRDMLTDDEQPRPRLGSRNDDRPAISWGTQRPIRVRAPSPNRSS